MNRQPKLNVLGGVVTLGGDVVPAAHTLTGNKIMHYSTIIEVRRPSGKLIDLWLEGPEHAVESELRKYVERDGPFAECRVVSNPNKFSLAFLPDLLLPLH
jgi:hypothetical protein